MKATDENLTTRCLRFWVNEPPERCKQLWQASDELTAAYNAMLEMWETEFRAEAVAVTEAAQEAYREWKDADRETRGPKPKWWKPGPYAEFAKPLIHVGQEVAPTVRSRLVDNMFQGEFLRDVKTYMERRFKDRIAAGIRHRAKGLTIALDQSTMRPDIQLDEDGVWSLRAALWAQGTSEAGCNEDRWRLSPYDRRRETWTMDAMLEAWHRDSVGGVRLVPPRKDAPPGKRRWSAMVTVKLPMEDGLIEERPNVAGVDLGVNTFAVYSCPSRRTFQFFSSRELQAKMERQRRDRRGVPRKRRQKIGAKNSRRQDTFCRQRAKQIIDCCCRDRVGTLRIEDLGGIRRRVEDPEDSNRNFMIGARFPFYKMKAYLEQAAAKRGIKIQIVNAAGTSQTCSSCGKLDPESRRGKRFVCTSCGYQCDADLNAANNIASGRIQRRKPPAPPAGSIPSAAPDHTGEAVQASLFGAELQPSVGGGDPFAGE